MGERGPVRTPTAVLKMRGSWRAKDRENEPQAKRGRPARPQGMDRRAKRLWEYLLPQLDDMGVLTLIDQKLLERYCVLDSEWHYVIGKCRNGVEWNDEGIFKWGRRLDAITDQLIRIERECGLTPAARARLAPPVQKGRPGRKEKLKEKFG